MISATARPNPAGIPYVPDAYVGADDGLSAGGALPPPTPRGRAAAVADEDQQSGTSPLVWVAGILAIVLLAAIAFLVFQLASGGGKAPVGQVSVPTLVGLDSTTAAQKATALGLTLAPTSQVLASGQVAGTVLAQDPAPGTLVDKGSAVKITVATAPGTVPVPDLKNMDESTAVQAIVTAGLKVGVRSEDYDPLVPLGLVARQTPTAGILVTQGTPIDYVISKGPLPTPSPTPSPTPTTDPNAHADTDSDAHAHSDADADADAQADPDPDAQADPDPDAGSDARPDLRRAGRRSRSAAGDSKSAPPRGHIPFTNEFGGQHAWRGRDSVESVASPRSFEPIRMTERNIGISREACSAATIRLRALSVDLDAGVVERSAELDGRLAQSDGHLGDVEVGEHLVADRLGERLEQPERGRFDDLADGGIHLAVVDRLLEVVIDAGGLEVETELDIDLERLERGHLVGVVAVTTLELHVGEHDPVAQVGPPSGVGRQFARTMASLIRAARRFGSTSWTRMRSTPPTMPSAVVAIVASRR